MDYTWRHLTVTDTPAWSALLSVIARYDGHDYELSADDLAEELADPGIVVEADTAAVTDSAALIAYATLHQPVERPDGTIRARFDAAVHPEHRRRGIGSELLQRMERRIAERGAIAFPGRGVRPGVGTSIESGAAFLEHRGYAPARYFQAMSRSLDAPIGPAAADAVAYRPELSEPVRLAHIDAFASHWDFSPPDRPRWEHWFTGSRALRPDCSAVALAADGSVDGYVLAYEYTPGEIYFGIIGVRERARGRGLGAGLVNRALAAAREAGLTTAKLDVDSANSTGAGRLYENAGFAVYHRSTAYERIEPL